MVHRPHIVFAGGGDLGNLYPGLAIAEQVLERIPNAQITFAGCGRPVERHTVRGAGHGYVALPCKPTPNNVLEAFRFVTDNIAGFWASRWMVKEQQVSLVVGLGGYASAGTVRSAHGCGIPFVLLEQNAVPSRTTRWMASAAEVVCTAFDEVRAHLPVDTNTVQTGTPGRPAFHRIRGKGLPSDTNPHLEKRLVIVGGAGGARSLNEVAPAAMHQLRDRLAGWRIVHQTGEGQLQETEQRYAQLGISALVVSYIDEMASLLAETDLVVCRSGGAMLSELALASAPAILTPDPNSPYGSQAVNAAIVARAGAARVIDESPGTGSLEQSLCHEVGSLLVDDSRRRQMAIAMSQLAKPQAAEAIANICTELLETQAPRYSQIAA